VPECVPEHLLTDLQVPVFAGLDVPGEHPEVVVADGVAGQELLGAVLGRGDRVGGLDLGDELLDGRSPGGHLVLVFLGGLDPLLAEVPVTVVEGRDPLEYLPVGQGVVQVPLRSVALRRGLREEGADGAGEASPIQPQLRGGLVEGPVVGVGAVRAPLRRRRVLLEVGIPRRGHRHR
jgi:hypothetical protein